MIRESAVKQEPQFVGHRTGYLFFLRIMFYLMGKI